MLDSMNFKFSDLSIEKTSPEGASHSVLQRSSECPPSPSTSAVGTMTSPASSTGSSPERTLEDLGLYQRQPSLAEEYTRLMAPGSSPGSTRNRAVTSLDLDNVMREFRMNGAESSYDAEMDCAAGLSHFGAGLLGSATGPLPASPLPAGPSGLAGGGPGFMVRQTSWPDPALQQESSALNNFLNSLSAAKEYATLLSREQQLRQLQLLTDNPDLFSALLQSTRLHRDRRSRKPLPTECAFCKNNGEQESYYSSHTLKDWAGRVTCPVLRAFRCPRCGATADHAHTIKYCPESTDTDHLPSIASLKTYRMATGKRRAPPSFGLQAPASPPWSQGSSSQPYPSSPSDLRRPPLF